MKFSESFAGILKIFFVFSTLFILSKCSNFENEVNFASAIKYYPKLPLNLINNTNNMTNKTKIVIQNILKRTEACENFFNMETKDLKIRELISKFDHKIFLSFIKSVDHLNDWSKNIFNDILEGRRDTNFTIHKLVKINMYSIVFSLDEIKTFYSLKSSETSVDLSKLFQLILQSYQKQKEGKAEDDSSEMSIQQRLYNIYDCLSLTILNGYAIIFDSLKLLEKRDNYYSKQYIVDKTLFKHQLLLLMRKSHDLVKSASQNIRPRDPKKYEEGVNFIQLKHFVRTHLMGKDYLIKPHSCSLHSCSDFNLVTSHEEFVGTKFQCNGFLYHCWKVSIQDICFPKNSTADRHYQAFISDGQQIGPWNSSCSGVNVVDSNSLTKLKQTNLVHNIFDGMGQTTEEINCDICACYCDDVFNPKTIRKFSLQEVRSKNPQGVVTGIKFAIDHDTIVLKIRVGILVQGVVDNEQQGWDSAYVLTANPKGEKLSTNKHPYSYASLNFEWRNIFLDDVKAPPGTFIQGVKFVKCDNGISISVLAAYFNENLEILQETAKWYSGCDMKLFSDERTEIIPKKDVPTKGTAQNKVISKLNSFISFQVSDWEIDASQTVIPFIDSQSIVTNPPVPISGIGLYYKAHGNYGGFIGLHLQTFDFSFLMVEGIVDLDFERLFTEKK